MGEGLEVGCGNGWDRVIGRTGTKYGTTMVAVRALSCGPEGGKGEKMGADGGKRKESGAWKRQCDSLYCC